MGFSPYPLKNTLGYCFSSVGFKFCLEYTAGYFFHSSIIVEKYLDLYVIIDSQAAISLSLASLGRTPLKDVVPERVDFIIIL